MSEASKRLPVFVFPNSLEFFAEEPSTHKQMVTIYNPYDFVVNFRVLCTAPWKYRIVEAEGSIKPHCCVDVVIRHISIVPNCYDQTDTFRVQMNEHSNKKLLGKKDFSVTLLPGKSLGKTQDSSTSSSLVENFRQFSSDSQDSTTASVPRPAHDSLPKHNYQVHGAAGPNYIAIAVAVVCIIALMLPSSEDQSEQSVWSIFHLSAHQKMVFAYSLGLVTMVILRPT